jgi:hypothetical protein
MWEYGMRPVERNVALYQSRTLGDYHGKINVRLRQGGMEST